MSDYFISVEVISALATAAFTGLLFVATVRLWNSTNRLALSAEQASERQLTALTDGPDDKKIDFIYLDRDNKRIVLTQGFLSNKAKDSAPANKASDLNTAAAWLFSGDISTIPETIREIIEECRTALDVEEMETIELFYVHNLPESVNVTRELQTVEEHIRKLLSSSAITVKATELGQSRIQHLYDSQDSHIEVKGDVEFPSAIAFEEKGPNWHA